MLRIEAGVKEIDHQLDHGVSHRVGGIGLHPAFKLCEHQLHILIRATQGTDEECTR
ncbi:hypothetical protein CQR52_0708 [Bifidobacterium pseudolongum subsp. pseudolongum]|nr:hypothetical protein CQR52_0708 [Bifidobacterium pseudolongum subsp. pseudolongum]